MAILGRLRAAAAAVVGTVKGIAAEIGSLVRDIRGGRRVAPAAPSPAAPAQQPGESGAEWLARTAAERARIQEGRNWLDRIQAARIGRELSTVRPEELPRPAATRNTKIIGIEGRWYDPVSRRYIRRWATFEVPSDMSRFEQRKFARQMAKMLRDRESGTDQLNGIPAGARLTRVKDWDI